MIWTEFIKEGISMANKSMRKCSVLPQKCKLKPQRDITTDTQEWLKLKRLTSNNGEDVK